MGTSGLLVIVSQLAWVAVSALTAGRNGSEIVGKATARDISAGRGDP